jgi:hypothetical protein
MNKFAVKHDFNKSRPPWRGDIVRMFGQRNEGVVVEAGTAEEAI